jgi:hypothetical protein
LVDPVLKLAEFSNTFAFHLRDVRGRYSLLKPIDRPLLVLLARLIAGNGAADTRFASQNFSTARKRFGGATTKAYNRFETPS